MKVKIEFNFETDSEFVTNALMKISDIVREQVKDYIPQMKTWPTVQVTVED